MRHKIRGFCQCTTTILLTTTIYLHGSLCFEKSFSHPNYLSSIDPTYSPVVAFSQNSVLRKADICLATPEITCRQRNLHYYKNVKQARFWFLHGNSSIQGTNINTDFLVHLNSTVGLHLGYFVRRVGRKKTLRIAFHVLCYHCSDINVFKY